MNSEKLTLLTLFATGLPFSAVALETAVGDDLLFCSLFNCGICIC